MGIWVGKFETSGTTSAPTIKPGLTSLSYQNVSTFFNTALIFTTNSNYVTKYRNSVIESHMMKNTEWGAVAYLKQSKYGLGTTDMGNNSYYNGNESYPHRAGCGPVSETNLTGTTSTCVSYTSTAGVMSSTTGNVYGVYDMGGGVGEYVMGVMQDNTNTNTPMSGKDSSYNSGYTGKLYNNGSYTSYSGATFPISQYYDLYSFGTTKTDSAAYARRILGDATGETLGWYRDGTNFLDPTGPWFFRGGYSANSYVSGAYFFSNYPGNADVWAGFRVAITPHNDRI